MSLQPKFCQLAINQEGFWQCIACGWTLKHKRDKPPLRNCPKAPSRGLGDTIAKVAKFFGIKPCGGCKKRRKKLNEMVPYRHEQENGSTP